MNNEKNTTLNATVHIGLEDFNNLLAHYETAKSLIESISGAYRARNAVYTEIGDCETCGESGDCGKYFKPCLYEDALIVDIDKLIKATKAHALHGKQLERFFDIDMAVIVKR